MMNLEPDGMALSDEDRRLASMLPIVPYAQAIDDTRALEQGGQAHWATARLPGSDFPSPFNRSAGRSAG